VGPGNHFAISGCAREGDAFGHQPPAETKTAFGDPAAFRFDARSIQKVCDDTSGDRLDFRAPAIFLAVEGRVTLDDPAHVTGLVRTKRNSHPGFHSRQPRGVNIQAGNLSCRLPFTGPRPTLAGNPMLQRKGVVKALASG
jgi:hypothetical protein